MKASEEFDSRSHLVMDAVEIRSADRVGAVILQPIAIEADHLPSLEISVDVWTGDFKGASPHIWLEASAVAEFVNQLKALERKRSGKAVISAMSPGEFELSIESADRWGHMLVQVFLARYVYVYSFCGKNSVTVNFELDPTTLPNVLNDFQKMHLGLERQIQFEKRDVNSICSS